MGTKNASPGSAKQKAVTSCAPVAPPLMTIRSGSNLILFPLVLPMNLATACASFQFTFSLSVSNVISSLWIKGVL